MEIIKTNSYWELSEKAFEIVKSALQKKPNLVLGLATGSTPLGLYKLLAESGLDFSQVKTFNLDEYYKPVLEKSRYRIFMEENLFSKINVKKENINFLNGTADDFEEECTRYEEAIKKAGGVDLQILGIGDNGHIAFNEPGSLADSRTRVVKLSQKTKEANARFFDSIDQVPTQALTMGIATILEAKEIILLAGKSKKEIIEKLLQVDPLPEIPASFLKKHQKCVIIYEDKIK